MWYAILIAAVLAGLAAFMQLPCTVTVRVVFEAQPLSVDLNVKSKLRQFNNHHYFKADELGRAILKAGGGNSSRVKKFLARQFLRQLVAQRVMWRTWLGLDDAMLTAVGSGAVWGIKGAAISQFKRIIIIKACKLEVNPDFYALRCTSQLDCIFKIRLVHYIYIANWMRLKRKGNKNGRRASVSTTGQSEPSH